MESMDANIDQMGTTRLWMINEESIIEIARKTEGALATCRYGYGRYLIQLSKVEQYATDQNITLA